MDYFKSFKASDGTTYSLDMVRLRCDFGHRAQDFTNYLGHLATYDVRFDVTYHPSFCYTKYRHLWNITDSESGCSWMVCMGIADNATFGALEFNPNKCEKSELFQGFLTSFRERTVTRELVRYDVAIDIPRPRGEVFLVRQGKRSYSLYQSDDGITEYSGKHNTSGFTKVYDKTKEAKLTEDITRVEVTLDKAQDFGKVFPQVRIRDSQQKLLVDADLDKRDKLLVKLLLMTEAPQVFLYDLDYRQRKRIEPYLGSTALPLDIKAYVSVRELALSYE